MKRASLVLCIGALVSGCSPIYYVPNSLNVPMIRDRGEATFSAHRGDQGSLNLDAAYSPANNWGVLADFYRVNVPSESNGGSGHGSFGEGGGGYYRPIKRRFFWDSYGLVGIGGVENDSPSGSSGTIHANFVRYGIQPSIGFRARFLDLALASRLVRLDYYNIRGTAASEVQYLNDEGPQTLFEPALTMRVGYDAFKLQVQVGHSRNLTDRNFKQSQDIRALGFVYTFGRH